MSRSVLPFALHHSTTRSGSALAYQSLTLVKKLVATLRAARPFRDAVRAAERYEQRWGVPPLVFLTHATMTEHAPSVPELPGHLVEQLSPTLPHAASAWDQLGPILDDLFTAMVTTLEVRRAVRAIPELTTLLGMFTADHVGCRTLAELLAVPDDLVIRILHRSQRKGFRVRLRGIVTLDQLQILAADRLHGRPSEGWLVGSRPDVRVVDAYIDQPTDPNATFASSCFALGYPDGRAVWGYESPRELPLWQGDPTLLLGDVVRPREWHAKRRFAALRAEFDVLEILTQHEVDRLLDLASCGLENSSPTRIAA